MTNLNIILLCTYMNSTITCFRALDHKHQRSDGKIINHLESHLKNGVLSRRERYGEFLWRVLSGMFRQPQDDIYIASPQDYTKEIWSLLSPDDIRSFLNWFDREHEAAHRVYLELSCPVQMDRYKNRQHVIHWDKVPIKERLIQWCIIRPDFIRQSTQDRIAEICGIYELPIIRI